MGPEKDRNQSTGVPDPEMLESLDLLLDMEALRGESDWVLLQGELPLKAWQTPAMDLKKPNRGGSADDQ